MAMLANARRSPATFASNFIASQSAWWIAAALFLLIAPGELVTALFGQGLSGSGTVVARLFGAELTGLALSSWVTRRWAQSTEARRLFACYFVCNALGVAVSVAAVAHHVLRSIGWTLVVLYLVYAAGFALLWVRGE